MLFSFSATSILSRVGCCGGAGKNSDQSEIIRGGPAAVAPFRNEVSAVVQARRQPVGRTGRDNREPDEKVRRYSALLFDQFFGSEEHPVLHALVARAYEKSSVFRKLLNDWGNSQLASATESAARSARHVAQNQRSFHDSMRGGASAIARESLSEQEQQMVQERGAFRLSLNHLIAAMLPQPNESAVEGHQAMVRGYGDLVMNQMQGLTPAGTRSAVANLPDICP